MERHLARIDFTAGVGVKFEMNVRAPAGRHAPFSLPAVVRPDTIPSVLCHVRAETPIFRGADTKVRGVPEERLGPRV
jgi:hypothetical protein